MGYMVRLGLWGPGTGFENFEEFIQMVDKRFVFNLSCTVLLEIFLLVQIMSIVCKLVTILYLLSLFFLHSGVGAMEMVAMEMKQRGMYVARQLSFKDVKFKVERVPLSANYLSTYNNAVDFVCSSWSLLYQSKSLDITFCSL